MAKEPSTITLTISLWDCLDVEVGKAEKGEANDREQLEVLAKGIRALLFMSEQTIVDAAENLKVWHDEENIGASCEYIKSLQASYDYKGERYKLVLSAFDPKDSTEFQHSKHRRALIEFDHSGVVPH